MGLLILYNALSQGLQHFKSLTEIFRNADSIQTEVIFNFGLADTYNLNDVRSSAPTLIYTDTFRPTEGISKYPLKSLLDTLQGGASLSKHPNKPLAETFQLNELRSALINKYLSEQANVTDLYQRVANYNRTHAEQLTLIDTKAQTLGRILTDTSTIGDSGLAKAAIKVLAENLHTTDNIKIVDANFLYFAEAVLATDTQDLASIFNRDYSDSTTIADLRSSHFGKIVNDTANILEVQSHQWAAYKTFLETFSLQEALERTSNTYRSFEESLQSGETAGFSSIFDRQFSETLTLSDVLSKLVNLGIVDALNLGDVREILSSINMIESLLTTDQFESTSVYSRALAEILVGGDSTSKAVDTIANDIFVLLEEFGKNPNLKPTDSEKVSDLLGTTSVFKRDYLDTGIITEELYRTILKDIETTERILDSDSKHSGIALIDQALISDHTNIGFHKSFTDTIRISDSFARETIWYKTIDNTVQIKYIIDMAMIRRKSRSGFIWKDSQEGSQKMFGKRRSKKGFSN